MDRLLKELENESRVQNEYIKNIKNKYMNTNSTYFCKLRCFYRDRNERVLLSRIKTKNEASELYRKLSTPSDKVYSEIIYERDVNSDISFILMQNELDLEEKGTSYLDRLIRILYDELEFYNTYKGDNFDYWNLDDYSNIHYELLGVKSEEAIYEMIKSINDSPVTYGKKISEVVYDSVSDVVKRDMKVKEKLSYKKMNR